MTSKNPFVRTIAAVFTLAKRRSGGSRRREAEGGGGRSAVDRPGAAPSPAAATGSRNAELIEEVQALLDRYLGGSLDDEAFAHAYVVPFIRWPERMGEPLYGLLNEVFWLAEDFDFADNFDPVEDYGPAEDFGPVEDFASPKEHWTTPEELRHGALRLRERLAELAG